MRILSTLLIAGIMTGMMFIPVHAEEVKVTSLLNADVEYLDGFDIIISDTGGHYAA